MSTEMNYREAGKYIHAFDWIEKLPDFGESYRMREMLNERATIPFKIQELKERADALTN